MVEVSDIADFLAARIYEDEIAAEDAAEDDPTLERWRADIKAKRGILLDYMTRMTRYNIASKDGLYYNHDRPSDLQLRYLAEVYASHPDYREWWTPAAPGTIAVQR